MQIRADATLFALERISAIDVSVLMLVGEHTDLFRRGVWELAGVFKNARVGVLAGQRHAAHQTATTLLADTLCDFFWRIKMAFRSINFVQLYYETDGSW